MSYSTWHDYGYGICTDDLKEDVSPERLMKLISTAPKLCKKVRKFIDEELNGQVMEISDLTGTYVEEHGEFNEGGLAEILYEAIKENEGIELLVSTDFDGKAYLIYPPTHPWILAKLSKKEQNLTEKQLVQLFAKYLHIVTDENLIVAYVSVANGG